ncbi:MAG TPA: hypothetical protein VFN35_24470 [Ktedonobacteraceae bacterium]|nr:hypothetical protein [Ktedonobacteraceae bacterium]
MDKFSEQDFLRYKLRKRESEAKAVPYVSFILTHVALVLFLVLSFFIDRFLSTGTNSLIIKILLAVLAVLLLASEWIYAIVTSRRWKKDIELLTQLEEEQRFREEQERARRQEDIIAAEQFRNRMLQGDIQRLRHSQQQTNPQGSYAMRAVRPPRISSFPSPGPNASQVSARSMLPNTPRTSLYPSAGQNTPQFPSPSMHPHAAKPPMGPPDQNIPQLPFPPVNPITPPPPTFPPRMP